MKRILILLLLAACGQRVGEPDAGVSDTSAAVADTAPIAVEPPTCSASSLDPYPPEQEGLPPAVAEMRRVLARAAVSCDYARLEALALGGAAAFTYSFGDDERPTAFWIGLEAQGEEPMKMLVRTLSLPYARETLDVEPFVFYVWPSAYLVEASDEEFLALGDLYSQEEIELFQEYGSFIGWRVGITETGDWRFFVAGD